MKTLLTLSSVLALILTGSLSNAQQITTPRTPSPAASISQTIGISTVSVSYSRPAVKGREVWGNLVPYGWNVQPFGAGNERHGEPVPMKTLSSPFHILQK